MIQTLIILFVMAAIIALIVLNPVLVQWRRDRLKQRHCSVLCQRVIEQTLPFYSRWLPDQRRQLQEHIQVFLAEKQFVGCAGLQVTEEMRVTIAAIACLLLLNGRSQYFPKVKSVLIYPTAYRVKSKRTIESFIVEERQEIRLGESWNIDQVVLAWDAVQWDVEHWNDGHNVVLHEFTHQLDQGTEQTVGVPMLSSQSDYAIWMQVMTQGFEQLCRDVEQGTRTVIDSYGATSGTEFFAVLTETFVEKPHLLLNLHPDLYEQLRCYYRLDPVQWF